MEVYKYIRIKLHEGGKMPEKDDKGDWYDLYTSEEVILQEDEFSLIPLGVSMQLPEGYEAEIAPRSSTFKNWGVLEANSVGVVDESYCGDDDVWHFPAYATRPVRIEAGSKICQFRIRRHQPDIVFKQVDSLGNPNRGGFGSTGAR